MLLRGNWLLLNTYRCHTTQNTQMNTHRTEHPAEHTEMPRFVVVPSPPSSPQSTLLNQGSGILCWHQSLRQPYHPTTKQLILSNWPWTWLGRPRWVEQSHFHTLTQSTQNPFLEITSLPLAWKAPQIIFIGSCVFQKCSKLDNEQTLWFMQHIFLYAGSLLVLSLIM